MSTTNLTATATMNTYISVGINSISNTNYLCQISV